MEQHELDLYVACKKKDYSTAIILINKGITRVISFTPLDNTLIQACSNFLFRSVAIALIKDPRNKQFLFAPQKPTFDYLSPLMHATKHGMFDVVLELIETGVSKPEYHCGLASETALTIACKQGFSEIALALIKTGKSDPGFITDTSTTALIRACVRKMSDVALALIATNEAKPEHGSLPKDRVKTAFELACEYDLPEVAAKLIEIGVASMNDLVRFQPKWGLEYMNHIVDVDMVEI